MTLELKHEKNQNVHDAVAQYVARDHSRKIFQYPFLYLAADTSDVMSIDPRRTERLFAGTTASSQTSRKLKENIR